MMQYQMATCYWDVKCEGKHILLQNNEKRVGKQNNYSVPSICLNKNSECNETNLEALNHMNI